jgi:hypothetical protein
MVFLSCNHNNSPVYGRMYTTCNQPDCLCTSYISLKWCICVLSFLRQIFLNITHWVISQLFLASNKNQLSFSRYKNFFFQHTTFNFYLSWHEEVKWPVPSLYKIISFYLMFKTLHAPSRYPHFIGSTPCLNTVKSEGYKREYYWINMEILIFFVTLEIRGMEGNFSSYYEKLRQSSKR